MSVYFPMTEQLACRRYESLFVIFSTFSAPVGSVWVMAVNARSGDVSDLTDSPRDHAIVATKISATKWKSVDPPG